MNVLEKILEEIKDLKEKQNSSNQDYATGYLSALSTVEGIISGAKENDGWIPVEERLPKKPVFGEDSYIVQHKCITTPYSAYWDGENWTEDYSDEPIRGIIAWRPLPKQYKPKKQD